MLRALLLWCLIPLACVRTQEPTAVPEAVMNATLGADVHSWSHPEQVRVDRIGLTLRVDFDARALEGTAIYELERSDHDAPLWLDTRALQIVAVERSAAAAPTKGLLADAAVTWSAAPWHLADADAVLGAGLGIALATDTKLVRVRWRTAPEASGLQWLDATQTADHQAPFLYSQSQAIHARSWFPNQDTPGVRLRWDARVHTPAPTRALMSADAVESDDGSFAFDMPQTVPSYLIALAVGALEFRALGPRTGVWAEPSRLPGAAAEFGDMEAMLGAVEDRFGPYRWGRYDLLVLPPAFPFGGMENPKLTFATPTIIAGDRSLVSLVAHELAHSWSGNLVTNATWADLWLNEGFTVYLERRIIEALFGRERADMEAVLGRAELDDAFAELAPADQRLRVDLRGRDPDEGLSDVAYEKGALLLLALEQAYGREAFDPFLARWFSSHAFGSVDTDTFVAFARKELAGRHPVLPGKAAVSLEAWLDGPGVPADAPVPTAAAFARIDQVVAAFARGETSANTLATKGWSPHEWLRFLRMLPKDIAPESLASLDARFSLSASGNAEILAQWLELAVRRGYHPADAALRSFLVEVGRRKFVLPLYQALLETDRAGEAARIYAEAKPGYHPITQASVEDLLTRAHPQPG